MAKKISAAERKRRALSLVKRLVRLSPDESTTAYALKMRGRLQLPMSVVLEKLWPDETVLEKSRRLGITRASYYSWKNGVFRPGDKMARRLAKLTGFTIEEIQGRIPNG